MTNLFSKLNTPKLKTLWLAIVIFVLALLPRATSLDVFLTPDEHRWMERSANFLDALHSRDWANTYQKEHPGVITMWLGSAGIYANYLLRGSAAEGLNAVDYFRQVFAQDEISLWAMMRMPLALANALSVVIVYLLARKLFDHRAALLAAILLALDPFHIALSRVIHVDALLSAFCIISVLSMLVYLQTRRWFYLISAGITTALAFLAKAPGLFLVGFHPLIAVLVTIWQNYPHPNPNPERERELIPLSPAGRGVRGEGLVRAVIIPGIIWTLVAVLTFVLCWPAVWQSLLDTFLRVFTTASELGVAPHLKRNFFLGELRADPGPFFYPVTALFRLTPLTTLGLIGGLIAWLRKRGTPRWGVAALWLFVLLFPAFLSIGAKKFDRYALPIFPMLDLLAAIGIFALIHEIVPTVTRLSARAAWRWGIIGVAVLQGIFSISLHPYYLAHYNQLLGGGATAARWLLVGWGEGLDRAMHYLDQLPNAAELTVAVWDADEQAPHFRGETIPLDAGSPEGIWSWTRGNYLVFYRSQVQRELPTASTVEYVRTQEPEHVVRINGIDYAWVYRGPRVLPQEVSTISHPQRATFENKMRLLGYDTSATNFAADTPLLITLYWECLQSIDEDYRVYMRVLDEQGHVCGQVDRQPVAAHLPTTRWTPGDLIRDVYEIAILVGTPPGKYRVEMGVYSAAARRSLNIADEQGCAQGTELDLGAVRVGSPESPPRLEDLSIQYPLHLDFNDEVRLLGYGVATRDLRTGDVLPLLLQWQARRTVTQDYVVIIQLQDDAGRAREEWRGQPAFGNYPTSVWGKGEVVRDWHDLLIPARLSTGEYTLNISLETVDTGVCTEPASLGSLTITGRERVFTAPQVARPLDINLGDKARLVGYDLRDAVGESLSVKPGDTLHLTLYWQSLAQFDKSYTAFVHLLDAEGNIWGQRDSIPGGGELPTTSWAPGEFLTDEYAIPVMPDAPAGKYTLALGLYDAETWQRLPVRGAVGDVVGDYVVLPIRVRVVE